MKVESFSFGSVKIDGILYEKDIIIDNNKISKREKSLSKRYRNEYGHTPLSVKENIPWKCKTLIIGTGHDGSLPVMDKVKEKAEELGVKLMLMRTSDAVNHLNDRSTNFVLHLTC